MFSLKTQVGQSLGSCFKQRKHINCFVVGANYSEDFIYCDTCNLKIIGVRGKDNRGNEQTDNKATADQ